VLSDNPDNSFLHFFFQDVVFALGIDLIKEFFLALFISIICFFLGHWDLSLGLQILLEHCVVFSGECFNCDCNLLAEVIIAIFTEWPYNELLEW
jgi:hypothetical protein